jgi:predicted DNA binding CopG/RHH family protein
MTNTKNNIPEFKTIQEEAEFWDTHDFTDFEDEFRPVKVKFSKPLEHVFAVRFDGGTLTDLQEEASKKGISAGTLIRVWVKERLQDRAYNRGAIKTA